MVRRVGVFAEKCGPEPLCTFGIFVNKKTEYLRVREVVLAGHGFEHWLYHFSVSELMR